MRRRLVALALSMSLLLAPRAAWAYRPFDGTDADVAEEGEFELELGPAHYLATPQGKYVLAPATVLNLGIFDRTELVVDAKNFVGVSDQPPGEQRVRLLDTDVFLKHVWRRGVLQDEEGPSVATEAGPLVPTIGGDPGFGAAVNVIVSDRFGPITLHLNSTGALTRARLEREWFESLIVEGPEEWTVRPVAEGYYDRVFADDGETTFSMLVGAIWRAKEGLTFDAGLRGSKVDGEDVGEIRLGLTWAVSVWEPHREAAVRD